MTSWFCTDSESYPNSSLLDWIEHEKCVEVQINRTKLTNGEFWFYDDVSGRIRNRYNSFFSIAGIKWGESEQPIIVQDEIGYLGIICKEIDGVIHFLMQAKIEPGNINKLQISPTLQATKSNFQQKHGGNKPAYLEYFKNAQNHEIIVDQIQSEQSSRFYKKRNRNIIIRVEDDIDTLPQFRWMTLGQIKRLMKIDNLINMDTRTVISCIPYTSLSESGNLSEIYLLFNNKALFRSIFEGNGDYQVPRLYNTVNDYKMFREDFPQLCRLDDLKHWVINDHGIFHKESYPFEVIYCDISIGNREVIHWKQPLFAAIGESLFGLLIRENGGVLQFLVRLTPEPGCFDGIEIGPTIQAKADEKANLIDPVQDIFNKYLNAANDGCILHDVMLSEEGGRFYHEQNRNIILKIPSEELRELPQGYFWLDYKTLLSLIQINNCLNIQLRNLISLLEV
jgi:oxidase EvaA